jgi:apoptosis-inducing factor 2
MRLQGDVTVLATGSSFSNPLMRASDANVSERKAFYAKFKERIAQAKSVLIVGGGPIGVEVAGEITDNFTNKKITILDGGDRILAGTSEAAARQAASVLTARGVNIICKERLERAGSPPTEVFGPAGEAITSGGLKISYDLIIWCIGGKPNTSYLQAKLSGLLNAAGRIRVTSQLRVEGMQTVFALGDITDLDENKMAWHITPQVNNAAFNIRQVLAGNVADADLKVHKPQTGNPMMAISIGRHTGVLHLPVLGVVRAPWMNRLAKAGHMLVPKYRKILGV